MDEETQAAQKAYDGRMLYEADKGGRHLGLSMTEMLGGSRLLSLRFCFARAYCESGAEQPHVG